MSLGFPPFKASVCALLFCAMASLAEPPGGGPPDGKGPDGHEGAQKGPPREARLEPLFDENMLSRLALNEDQKKQMEAFESSRQSLASDLEKRKARFQTQLQAGLVLLNDPMREEAENELLEVERQQMELRGQRTRLFLSLLRADQVRILQNQFYILLGY